MLLHSRLSSDISHVHAEEVQAYWPMHGVEERVPTWANSPPACLLSAHSVSQSDARVTLSELVAHLYPLLLSLPRPPPKLVWQGWHILCPCGGPILQPWLDAVDDAIMWSNDFYTKLSIFYVYQLSSPSYQKVVMILPKSCINSW